MQASPRQGAGPPSVTEIEELLPTESFQRQRAAGRDLIRHTPLLESRSLSERCGGPIVLKAENLQRTGSFKIRGTLAKLERLRPDDAAAGVVAGSAGNHGQALAYAARARGVPCRVYMPSSASVSKVAAVEAFAGAVVLEGASVDECVDLAAGYAEERGAVLVHPFDDIDVLSGQGTLGLELLEDAPKLARLIVPIGGGGLAGSTAMVLKRHRPEIQVIGVQAKGFAPLVEGGCKPDSGSSLADGIAIKSPGAVTRPLIDRFVDQIEVVTEEAIAEAMVLLLERAKLLVEGAGAASLAALLSGHVVPAPRGATVALLSGGNVDPGVLSRILRRNETESGRRLRFLTRVPDRPGGLTALLSTVAESGANLLSVEHVRDAVPLHVRETGVEVILETRGTNHSAAVLDALRGAGHEVAGVSPGDAGQATGTSTAYNLWRCD